MSQWDPLRSNRNPAMNVQRRHIAIIVNTVERWKTLIGQEKSLRLRGGEESDLIANDKGRKHPKYEGWLSY